MTTIKILPEIVSNKIAAGEVVERPASVVKELLENAMDAESTKVFIEVEKGGKSLIRVSDNGTGMNRDDALLSIERYATSKIFNDQDLYAIRTLGFRGEALPSIAAVSRFSLITRHRDSREGTEIIVHGGKITRVSEAGAPAGSMVAAAQLFYNTPARRKFLKTMGTEMGHISDIVSGIALGRPDIRFRLDSDGKTVKDWTAVSDPRERAADVLGRDVRGGLLPVEWKSDPISINGWVADPEFTRSTSRGIYVYVNGRHVRDRVIQHALFEGYGRRLVKGKFPMAVLFLKVPFDQVDVNVHPAKQEVRFGRQKEVHDFLAKAVSRALDKKIKNSAWSAGPAGKNIVEPSGVSEPLLDYGARRRMGNEPPAETIQQSPQAQPVRQAGLWEAKETDRFRIIGQFQNTYILCESEEGLVLIDQHAAHERILFEQLRNKYKEQSPDSQKLLMPETFEAGHRESEILEKLIPDLEKTGVEIESFGKDTFVVKSVPAVISGKEIKPVLLEMAEKLADTGFMPGIMETIDTCLILMACHGAIRANQSLSDNQMKKLVDQLDACEDPSHCPHGRPTWVTWSPAVLEKAFGRKD